MLPMYVGKWIFYAFSYTLYHFQIAILLFSFSVAIQLESFLMRTWFIKGTYDTKELYVVWF